MEIGSMNVDHTQKLIRKNHLFATIVLIILGVIVYANSFNGQFIWDDDLVIKNNIYITQWQYLPKIFTEDVGIGAGQKFNFYRPLQMLSYMVDYSFWELNVQGYHLTNIMLHILASIMLYYFVTVLTRDNLLSLLTSILFIAHPIHTEAVAFMSGRQDSLAMIFILASFILYIKYLQTSKIYLSVWMVICYILALLSKEISLILPALIIVYHYAYKEKIRWRALLTIVGCSLIYFTLRVTVLKSSFAQAHLFMGLPDRIPGFFVAISHYVRLLLVPFDLHAEYGYELFQMNDPKVMLGISLMIVSLIYAVAVRTKNSLLCFAFIWFFYRLATFFRNLSHCLLHG